MVSFYTDVFSVCELIKLLSLCSLGQRVHLPNLVHTGGVLFLVFVSGFGGYEILLEVNRSLRLGSLLKPISGFSGKNFCNSSVLSKMSQLSLIILFVSTGYHSVDTNIG